jgi:hypothetical protein
MKEIIEILEEKPFGFLVRNHTRKVNQILPKEYLKKKIGWGLYKVINELKFQSVLKLV